MFLHLENCSWHTHCSLKYWIKKLKRRLGSVSTNSDCWSLKVNKLKLWQDEHRSNPGIECIYRANILIARPATQYNSQVQFHLSTNWKDYFKSCIGYVNSAQKWEKLNNLVNLVLKIKSTFRFQTDNEPFELLLFVYLFNQIM